MGKPGYVYLIHSDTGHYKIGWSVEPRKRLKIFSVEMPIQIRLLHYFYAEDALLAERLLHERFAEKRVSGEWFRLAEQDVELICSFCRHYGGQFDSLSRDGSILWRSAKGLSDEWLVVKDEDGDELIEDYGLYMAFEGVLVTTALENPPHGKEIVERFEAAIEELRQRDLLYQRNFYKLTEQM